MNEKNCVSTTFAKEMYLKYLIEPYDVENLDERTFAVGRLEKRLLRAFRKQLKVIDKKHEGKFYVAMGASFCLELQKDKKDIQRAALLLRQEILRIIPKKLLSPITTEKIVAGECEIPDMLCKFYTTLLGAYNARDRKSEKSKLLVKSLSSDAIFNVTRGKVTPSENLTLACTLKSLTSSHQNVRILNRYVHILSDDVIQNVETEAAYDSLKADKVCPNGVSVEKGLGTVYAFDNFDIHIDSIMGKTIMNDTNGIVIQNVAEAPTESDILADTSSSRAAGEKPIY